MKNNLLERDSIVIAKARIGRSRIHDDRPKRHNPGEHDVNYQKEFVLVVSIKNQNHSHDDAQNKS